MAFDPSNEIFESDNMDYWRLCDELSVMQAALLIVGYDPSEECYAEKWELHKRPKGYEAAKAAVSNALRRGAIDGNVIPSYEHDNNGNRRGTIKDSVDVEASTVVVDALRAWLANRGFHRGFSFQPRSLHRTTWTRIIRAMRRSWPRRYVHGRQ